MRVLPCDSLGLVCLKIHRATGDHRGDGVLVDHLGDGVAKQHHVLVEGLDLALQLDAVDEVDGHRDTLLAKLIEERVLQQLSFVTHCNSFLGLG